MNDPDLLFASITVAAILASIIYFIRRNIAAFNKDKKRIELVKKATEQNHVLKGKLVKRKTIYRSNTTTGDRETYDLGIYHYEYNGKTYKAKYYSSGPGYYLPKELDLFYINNPKKAVSEYALGYKKIRFLKPFLIILVLLLWMFWGDIW